MPFALCVSWIASQVGPPMKTETHSQSQINDQSDSTAMIRAEGGKEYYCQCDTHWILRWRMQGDLQWMDIIVIQLSRQGLKWVSCGLPCRHSKFQTNHISNTMLSIIWWKWVGRNDKNPLQACPSTEWVLRYGLMNQTTYLEDCTCVYEHTCMAIRYEIPIIFKLKVIIRFP